MRAAARAFDILELLAQHPTPLPAAVIARMCEVPRSTTYKLLATLHERGLVRTDDEGRWTAGDRLRMLGGAPPTVSEAIAVLDAFERGSERLDADTIARRSGLDPARMQRLLSLLESESLLTRADEMFGLGARLALLVSGFQPLEDLRIAARPALAELRSRSGETANLLVADGDAAVYIDQAGASESGPAKALTGRRVPLAGSACGRALAAGRGAHTVSDAIEPGVTAVACAVRSSSSYPAVISAVGATARMCGSDLSAVEEMVTAAAEATAARLTALSRHAVQRSRGQ
jgi:DNA-binding IclR family transcriptional regulator